MKPRLVKHVDDAFIETLTDLYLRELTPVRCNAIEFYIPAQGALFAE